MARMLNVAVFVILLGLENVYEILLCFANFGDVQDLILPFLLMIWWVRNLEFSLTSRIIYLKESVLGEAMLKTKPIESDGSDLNPQCFLILLERHEQLRLQRKLLLTAADTSTQNLLLCDIVFELRNLKGFQDSSNWDGKWIESHELTMVTVEFQLLANS